MRFTIPNQLTIIRILLTPIFVYFFLQADALSVRTASLIYLLASLTDWYDGYIARRWQQVTRFGQFMDPLADKVLVSAALAVFAWQDLLFGWMVLLIIGRDFLVTGLRLFALYIGKPIVTTVIAKWKTFVQMAFIFVLLIYLNIPGLPDIRLSSVPRPYLLWTTLVMYLILGLTLYSGLHYLVVNRSHGLELAKRTWRLIFNLFRGRKNA